jgi:hypothetical protein
MGSKTLERRLAERSQSFSALLDATRYNAAKHYLEETDMRIAQVAYWPAILSRRRSCAPSSAGRVRRPSSSATPQAARRGRRLSVHAFLISPGDCTACRARNEVPIRADKAKEQHDYRWRQ